MTFLPIVAREMRVASRRPVTFWSRPVMAGLAIIVGAFVYVPAHRVASSSQMGMTLSAVFCWLAYIHCLLVGLNSTADCLSEEKREGTLGLLFLTDLKGYDVVGGKLVATSLNPFFNLLAIFPVMAVPLMMGGVTNGECWRAALVLVNTFLFSLSIGMLASALCISPRKARAATLIAILIFTLGLPACWSWVPSVHHSHAGVLALKLICPDTSMYMMSDMTYRMSSELFWWSTEAIFGLSCLCLVVACLIVPHSWQDNPPGAKSRRGRGTWQRWRYGAGAERFAYRKRLLNINAFYWLASRERLGPFCVWTTLAILAGLWCWGAYEERNDWLEAPMFILTAIVLNSTLKCWVASEAGKRLGEDRRIGALELLLSTPLRVEEILRGQLLALKRQFLSPLVISVIAQAILLLLYLRTGRTDHDEVAGVVSSWVAYTVMLIADLAALSCVGMWMGLSAKNPVQSTSMTIRRVLLLPWAIFFAVWLICGILYALIPELRNEDFTWRSSLTLYCVIGFAVDVWFGVRAWTRLHKEFREIATKRFSPKRSFWSRLLGRQNQPASRP